MTFHLDLHRSVGVFHTVIKGLLGKGGPSTGLQVHCSAKRLIKSATTKINLLILDAIFVTQVLCHMSHDNHAVFRRAVFGVVLQRALTQRQTKQLDFK